MRQLYNKLYKIEGLQVDDMSKQWNLDLRHSFRPRNARNAYFLTQLTRATQEKCSRKYATNKRNGRRWRKRRKSLNARIEAMSIFALRFPAFFTLRALRWMETSL